MQPYAERHIKHHTHTHLCEHGFAVLCDHRTLITVQRHKVVVEGLFRVLENVVELSGAAFKHTPKVARNQRPADRCERQ